MVTVSRSESGAWKVEGGTAEERAEVNKLLMLGMIHGLVGRLDVDRVAEVGHLVGTLRREQRLGAQNAAEVPAEPVPA